MKTFIRNCNTLDNTDNSLIKYYECDACIDLPNLEVGQLVQTPDEGGGGSGGIDSIRPIGSTYVQFPDQLSPNDLFTGTTWEAINYDGAFFRADNGPTNYCGCGFATCSDTLSNCLQGQATSAAGLSLTVCSSGCHVHSASTSYCKWRCFVQKGTGRCCYRSNIYQNLARHYTNTTGAHTHTVTFSGGGSETRPKNYTIIVWKRIA